MERYQGDDFASKGPDTDIMKESFRHLGDGLSSLVKGHLDLARTELTHDMKAVAKDSAIAAAGLPLLFVGYLLLWGTIAALLALALPVWAALLICTVVNLGAGVALTLSGKQRLGHDKVELPASSAELARDKEWFGVMKQQLKSPERTDGEALPARSSVPASVTRH